MSTPNAMPSTGGEIYTGDVLTGAAAAATVVLNNELARQ